MPVQVIWTMFESSDAHASVTTEVKFLIMTPVHHSQSPSVAMVQTKHLLYFHHPGTKHKILSILSCLPILLGKPICLSSSNELEKKQNASPESKLGFGSFCSACFHLFIFHMRVDAFIHLYWVLLYATDHSDILSLQDLIDNYIWENKQTKNYNQLVL